MYLENAIEVIEYAKAYNKKDVTLRFADAEDCVISVNRMPLADVTPVRYGQWEPIINAYGELEGWICKRCGTETKQKSNYCPNCGAKMDEV